MAKSPSIGRSNVATISVEHPPSIASSSASFNNGGTAVVPSDDPVKFSSSANFTTVSSDSSNSDHLTESSPIEHSTVFTRFMDTGFRNLGYFITDYAKIILTIVVIFTLITSIKIPFTKQEDDLKTGYTPNGARSHQEVAMHEEFYSKNGSDPISVVVFIIAKDNGTLTRSAHLNATVQVMDDIGNNFIMPNHGNKSSGENFYEFCTDFCEFNEPVRHYRNGFVIQNEADYALLQPGDLFDSRFNLSFPFMSVLGRELDLSPLLFGVRKFSSDDAQRQANKTTNIENLPLIVLQFRADKPKYATKEDVMEWERSIERYYQHKFDNEHIRTMVLSVTVAADEIVKNGMTLFPFIILGFIILSTFALISGYLSSYYFDQWTIHKVSLAILACVCPLLATSSSLGLLFWFGFRFGSILAVTPFLILCLGVDDAFLMIHSWQRICVEQRKLRQTTTLKGVYGDSLRNRIAEVFVDVGPSISITSLTNAISFVIGIFSPTPEITLFCAGNAVAILFDYFYQFVFFGSVMAIAGDYEMKSEPQRDMKSLENLERNKRRKKLHIFVRNFLKHYCQWLADSFTSILMLLCLIVYWIVSIRGALNIHASITPNKLFLADSPVNELNELRDTYILPNYTAINVFVNNAGNLSSPQKQQRVRDLIAEYENMPLCLGSEYTHFWLRDFDRFLETTTEDEESQLAFGDDTSALTSPKPFSFTHKEMQQFLNWPEYRHWNAFIKFDSEGNLSKFFAVIGFHGKEFVSWNTRGDYLNKWRAIADKYPDLEAWVFEDDAQFLDQIETLIPSTLSSSIVTLLCMAVICIIFMFNLFTVCVATLSIMSVCIGVFGFLSMWGIDLDPISMATTIMSIGFSVDFPAHASFHYFRTGIESGGKWSPEQRIYHVLSAIGFPLLQCGFSTIFFVFCLLFVPSYMSEVFVKTMVLVIIFGLIHGLFVIPVALCSLTRVYESLFTPKMKIRNTIKKLQKSNSFKNMMSVAKTHPDDKNIAKVTVHDHTS